MELLGAQAEALGYPNNSIRAQLKLCKPSLSFMLQQSTSLRR